jgi:6-phosphogluconolactonase (cycloisomerase 2 family)
MLEPQRRRLWCLDEGNVAGLGSINTFSIDKNGTLQRFQRKEGIGIAPVHSVFFNDGKALAVAMYGGGVGFFHRMENGTVCGVSFWNFTLANPKAAPQDKSRPHGFAVDPSGSFLVSPDLGADLVRTFNIDKNKTSVSLGPAVSVAEGTGPRHATFWSPAWKAGEHWDGKGDVFLYVIGELSSTITTFKVGYLKNGTLDLRKLGETKNFGGRDPNRTTTPKASEIMVSVSAFVPLLENAHQCSAR